MSGNVWMFSDEIDDEDLEMCIRDRSCPQAGLHETIKHIISARQHIRRACFMFADMKFF